MAAKKAPSGRASQPRSAKAPSGRASQRRGAKQTPASTHTTLGAARDLAWVGEHSKAIEVATAALSAKHDDATG